MLHMSGLTSNHPVWRSNDHSYVLNHVSSFFRQQLEMEGESCAEGIRSIHASSERNAKLAEICIWQHWFVLGVTSFNYVGIVSDVATFM